MRIASVATGFPSGQFPLDVRLRDVADAVAAGAHEIDMVISRGAFLAGRFDEVAEEIRRRTASHVILFRAEAHCLSFHTGRPKTAMTNSSA